MQCTDCGTRVFTSRAAELVATRFKCPRCMADVRLVAAAQHQYGYPTVRPITASSHTADGPT